MSENKPALSTRYFLTLEESQDGFALATFGKKQMTRFITPLISVGIIVWGFMLGFSGIKKCIPPKTMIAKQAITRMTFFIIKMWWCIKKYAKKKQVEFW